MMDGVFVCFNDQFNLVVFIGRTMCSCKWYNAGTLTKRMMAIVNEEETTKKTADTQSVYRATACRRGMFDTTQH